MAACSIVSHLLPRPNSQASIRSSSSLRAALKFLCAIVDEVLVRDFAVIDS